MSIRNNTINKYTMCLRIGKQKYIYIRLLYDQFLNILYGYVILLLYIYCKFQYMVATIYLLIMYLLTLK